MTSMINPGLALSLAARYVATLRNGVRGGEFSRLDDPLVKTLLCLCDTNKTDRNSILMSVFVCVCVCDYDYGTVLYQQYTKNKNNLLYIYIYIIFMSILFRRLFTIRRPKQIVLIGFRIRGGSAF